MEAIALFRDGLLVVVWLSAPALVVTTVLGIAVSILQGLFQIQDQALSYTVKLVALSAVLLLTGSWMQNELVSLVNQMFMLLSRVR